MALRVLVFAALRVLAIYLVVQVLELIPMLASMFWMTHGVPEMTLRVILAPLSMILVALILWFVAGRLAVGVTRPCDPTIQVHLTLEDAYAIAFVVLGLYFVLYSLGSTATNLYRLISATSEYPTGDAMRSQRLSDLYRTGITLGAGFAALVGHRLWARKLARSDAFVGE